MRDRWQFAPYQRLLVIGVIALVGLSAVLGVSLLGTDLLRRTHADQSPANCSSNDFVLTVQKSLTYFSDTAAVHYTVLAGNPNTSGAGCDVGGVTLSLTTPDGTVHPLGDDLDYPIGTAEAVIGGASYVPSTSAPDYNGWFGYNGVAWVAMAEATGQLLNNPVQDDPWQVRKTVSVVSVSIAMSALASPPGEVPAGTVVTVSFVLHNDGIGPLENPQVTSPQCSVAPVPPTGSNRGDVNGNGVADPGETWIFTCPLVVTESIDVTGVGSGRLAASDLVIDPSNDPDATVTLRIHVAASDDPTGDGPTGDGPTGDDSSGDSPTGDGRSSDGGSGDDPSGDDTSGDDPTGDDTSGDDPTGDDSSADDPTGDDTSGDDPTGDDPTGDQPATDDPAGDQPAGDESAGDDPAGDSSRDGPAVAPPSGLPDAGSGGLLGMSGAAPLAYGAIVMGLLTLGFAFFLRRVAGRSGMRRGEG